MDDLISRQAVKNIMFNERVVKVCTHNGEKLKRYAEIDLDDFDAILSARPEVDEWCTDCPSYDHEKHYCPRFRKVIRRTVQEIQEERIPEHSAWFRISETLVDESKGDITAEHAVEKIRDYLKRMEKPERKKVQETND